MRRARGVSLGLPGALPRRMVIAAGGAVALGAFTVDWMTPTPPAVSAGECFGYGLTLPSYGCILFHAYNMRPRPMLVKCHLTSWCDAPILES